MNAITIPLGELVRVELPGHKHDGEACEVDAIINWLAGPRLILKPGGGAEKFQIAPADVVPVSLRRLPANDAPPAAPETRQA